MGVSRYESWGKRIGLTSGCVAAALVGVGLAAGETEAQAQTWTWTGDVDGDWGTDENWSPSDPPPNFSPGNETTHIVLEGTQNQSQVLGAKRWMRSLTFENGGFDLDMDAGGGGEIRINNQDSNDRISSTGNNTISGGQWVRYHGGLNHWNSNLDNNGEGTLTVNTRYHSSSQIRFDGSEGGHIVFNGPITGDNGIRWNGGTLGSLTLNADNTADPFTDLTSVRLRDPNAPAIFGHDNAIGTGRLQVDSTGGQIAAGGGDRTFDNWVQFGGTIHVTGDHDMTLTGAGGDVRMTGSDGDRMLHIAEGRTVTVNSTIREDDPADEYVLVKGGAGVLALGGANTYADGTRVEAGTLLTRNTTGSATGSGDVHVEADGTLGGDGVIGGNVTVDGILSPGQSIGDLTLEQGMTLNAGSQTLMPLSGSGSGDYDRVLGLDSLSLGGTLQVELLNFDPEDGDTFQLFSADSINSQFEAFNLPELGGGLAWETAGLQETGSLQVVPEPGSLALLGLGGALFLVRSRRA